jgi:hypothetical protein
MKRNEFDILNITQKNDIITVSYMSDAGVGETKISKDAILDHIEENGLNQIEYNYNGDMVTETLNAKVFLGENLNDVVTDYLIENL